MITSQKIWLISIGISFGILGISYPHACSCASTGNILERKFSNDLAFDGRLVSESMDTLGLKKMKFAVSTIFRKGKQEKAKWVYVESYEGSAICGFDMNKGENAIIFANIRFVEGRKRQLTTLCNRNIVKPNRQQIDSLQGNSKSNY